jgi:restriction endonuclease S subunit
MRPQFAMLREKNLSNDRAFPLKLLCARAITRGTQPEYDDTQIRVVKTGTLRNGELDWSDMQTVSESCFTGARFRAAVRRGDVLVSSTGVGSLGKIDVYDRDEPALADSHISIVRLREESYPPVLLANLMRHRVVQWQIEQGLTGSTNQIDIYPEQIGALRIPFIPESRRRMLAERFLEIESAIAAARRTLRNPQDIINEVLCTEFGYPLEEYRHRTRESWFRASLGSMSAGFTLRSSARFHHPSSQLTELFFARVPHERVKAFVVLPIRLGATATKADLVEAGEAYYVHPGAIRYQGRVALEDCHQVTSEFFRNTERRFGLRPDDVVINRSGEALGKVALWQSDQPAVASDFTMRMRFDARRLNPRFAWLYFRSVMFQSQIYREIRGSSVPNIFPSELEQMLIVKCEKSKQDALARDIEIELQRRQDSLTRIESRRMEITALIDAEIGAL